MLTRVEITDAICPGQASVVARLPGGRAITFIRRAKDEKDIRLHTELELRPEEIVSLADSGYKVAEGPLKKAQEQLADGVEEQREKAVADRELKEAQERVKADLAREGTSGKSDPDPPPPDPDTDATTGGSSGTPTDQATAAGEK